MRVTDVAIAVATLDRPRGLGRCLRAVLEGELLPRELIVVDQGATSSLDVVRGLAVPAEVRVRYLRQARLGLSASRNAAVRDSTAPVVAFSDDDCVPEPEWLSTIVGAFDASAAVAAVTGPVLPLGVATPGTYAVASRTGDAPVEYAGYTPPWQPGTGGNMAVRRDWLRRIGGFDERLGVGTAGAAAEDIELIFRLLRSGGRIRFEPRAVVRHERQSAERRRSTRRTYGRGIGAVCGVLARQREPVALRILFDWTRLRGRRAAGGLRRGRIGLVREEWEVFLGTLAGIGYGVSAGALPRRDAPAVEENPRELRAEVAD